MTWSTERAGDFLITAWLEGCTVGGCAKACAVEPGPLDPGSPSWHLSLSLAAAWPCQLVRHPAFFCVLAHRIYPSPGRVSARVRV